MKLKLLVVLMALISFSSCKKVETSAIELDKSETVMISGTVSIKKGSIPEGTEIVIVVKNHEYNDAHSPSGEQLFYAPIASDGTYSYELPIGKRTEVSSSTYVELILPPFTNSEGHNHTGYGSTTINFFDKEVTVDLEYDIEGSRYIIGEIINNDGEYLPSSMTIQYTSSTGEVFSQTVYSGSSYNTTYELFVIETGYFDSSNLEITPSSYTSSSNGYSYSASYDSYYSRFTYYRNY